MQDGGRRKTRRLNRKAFLNDRCEKVSYLYFTERKTVKEIAKEVGLSIKSVYRLLKIARDTYHEEAKKSYSLSFDFFMKRYDELYKLSMEAYNRSMKIVEEQEIASADGRVYTAYLCSENATVSGDPRFLDLAIKTNDRLYALYQNSGSALNETKEKVDFFEKAEKLLAGVVNEQGLDLSKLISVQVVQQKSDENGNADENTHKP